MSIINDALKKAQKTNAPGAPGLGVELQSEQHRRAGFNWGPVFVVAVLLLVTGPIIAPVFSTPFRKQASAPKPAMQAASVQLAQAPAESPAPATRQAQFGMEEAPFLAASPYTRPNLLLSGVIYSAKDSYVLMNDRVLREGESVDGAKIAKVTPNEVIVDYHGERIILPVPSA